MQSGKITWIAVLSAALTACSDSGDRVSAAPRRLEFSRMLVHWRQYTDPGYLAFVDQAQPELVQAGFCGVDFWGLARVPDREMGSGRREVRRRCRG